MLKLLATKQFQKDLKKLPTYIVSIADNIIPKLRLDPLDSNLNIKKLKNIEPTVWRLRVGNYRLVYSFDKANLSLLRFRHRKDIYRF